ncbi:MAG: CPBP family intramembrane metalloprotease [Clostridia bacterium]|nr:CPBP family intramembrane metalloprotease [Clostridia bacterium]
MKLSLPQKTNMIQEAQRTGRGHRWGLEILIFLLVFFISQVLISIPVSVATVIWMFTLDDISSFLSSVPDMPDWLMLVQLFATALTTVCAILFCRWIEKRSAASMGLRKKRIGREYLIGTGVGILMISATVLLCTLGGSLTWSTGSFSLAVWLLYLLGFLIQGMSEEVLCRGYLMVSVARKNAMVLAVAANSVLFALLHILNPGIGILPLVNIALFGAFESVYVLKRGDLWGACAIHSLWNFFQGNVFGVSVSGTGSGTSILQATAVEGKEWLNGGLFGVEGGVAVTLVTTVALLIILFLVPTRKDEIATAEEGLPAEPSIK